MLIVITDKEDNCHYCEDIQFAMNSKLIRKILWYENQEKNLPVRLPSISGEILSFIISWIKCPQSLNLEELANKDFFVCDSLLFKKIPNVGIQFSLFFFVNFIPFSFLN